MNTKLKHQLNDSLVQQRITDGYIDATAMCGAANKRWIDYFDNDNTKDFLEALSKSENLALLKLVISKPGRYGGTWVHPKVAIHLGQWLSPEFAVQVSNWVFDWMTKGGNPVWQEQRKALKETNSDLSKAIADYISRHSEELSDNKKRWMYTNVNDALCITLTGLRVSKYCRDNQVESFRDRLTAQELKNLELLEIVSLRLINTDLFPLDAIREAKSRILI